MSLEIVLATHNAHKAEEFQQILSVVLPSLAIVTYDGPDVVENGTSFAANAFIKARAAAAHTGKISMAEDSGIAVDIFGGSPGIFSARWAGQAKSDQANLYLLLAQLSDIAPEHRAASFLCTIAIVSPGTVATPAFEKVAVGCWSGMLATEAQGEHGFGYDSIFLPEGFAVSAAQMSSAEKNAHSHRSKALTRLVPLLRELCT